MHVVYKYYTNMSVNRLLVWKLVYLEPVLMSSTQKVVLAQFSLSHIQSGVTTDVLGRPSTYIWSYYVHTNL